MAKILTIGTLKGGVGKSNFSFNLGGILATNKRVLLIDLDAQANLTLNVGVDVTEQKYTIKDILEKDIKIEKAIIKNVIEHIPNLHIVTSDILLCETEVKLFSYTARESLLQRYFEKNNSVISDYDYIIIDTNPSFSIINQNAFLVSDEIILLSDVSLNGIQGTELFIALWEKTRKALNKKDNVHTLVLNNLDRRIKLSKELINFCYENETIKKIIADTIIYNNIKIKETELEHLPINLLYPNSEQHNNYLKLINELTKKCIL